ncbi:MAG TPA: thioredoxin domain-containing protein [Solirubrobacterales bacterium]|nr:thioredoxin domain-containing protein [Solirubrobacterales bacterium]
MSNKKEREKRREEREAAESQVSTVDRRKKLLQMGAGAVFLVVVVIAVLIVVSSAGDDGGDASNIKDAAEVEQELSGIEQKGLLLGDPNAPVELIEFGDLQCPVCKANAEEALPGVIEGKVAAGEAKFNFRNFIIISEESEPAGAAALAAGEQGRGFNYLNIFYRNQGIERSGYVTDEFLTAIAEAAKVPDIAQWNKDRESSKVKNEVKASTEEALRIGFEGTPSFAVKGPKTNGLELLGNLSSTEEIEEAIDAAG